MAYFKENFILIKVAFLSQAGHMLHLIVEAWLASDVLPGANVMYSE